jgi:hypothetical protein
MAMKPTSFRLPDCTLRQLAGLVAKCGGTATQVIIVAVDRMAAVELNPEEIHIGSLHANGSMVVIPVTKKSLPLKATATKAFIASPKNPTPKRRKS